MIGVVLTYKLRTSVGSRCSVLSDCSGYLFLCLYELGHLVDVADDFHFISLQFMTRCEKPGGNIGNDALCIECLEINNIALVDVLAVLILEASELHQIVGNRAAIREVALMLSVVLASII